MEFTLIVLPVLVVTGVWLWRRRANRNPGAANAYEGLRNLALKSTRADLRLAAAGPDTPWGAVMEWHLGNGIATVVAYADGTASIYLSTGGGNIGGGQSHESIRTAGARMLAAARASMSLLSPAQSFPLPAPGEVAFYALTDNGVFTARAVAADMPHRTDALGQFGSAAQDIITQYRLIDEGTNA